MFKAYKVFDKDWTDEGHDFKTKNGSAIGSIHEEPSDLEGYKTGFHFCRKLSNCFSYKDFDPKNHVAEIEVLGEVIVDQDDIECTKKFHIVREIMWEEALFLCNTGDNNTGDYNSGDNNTGDRNSGDNNTGDRNSGDRNSGDYNSGDRNSGDYNSGDSNTSDNNTGDCNTGHVNTGHRNTGNWNSGDRNSGNYNTGDYNSGDGNTGDNNTGDYNSGNYNSGNWNAGDYNSGDLNTTTPFRMFNQFFPEITREDVVIPDFFYFRVVAWVSIDTASAEEQKDHKQEIETCGGFLKTLDYKEAWKRSYQHADQADREKVKNLPGFDKKIFFEISGIMVD